MKTTNTAILKQLRTYLSELNTPIWGKPKLFETVEGWRPGNELRKKLLLQLKGDILSELIRTRHHLARLQQMQPTGEDAFKKHRALRNTEVFLGELQRLLLAAS